VFRRGTGCGGQRNEPPQPDFFAMSDARLRQTVRLVLLGGLAVAPAAPAQEPSALEVAPELGPTTGTRLSHVGSAGAPPVTVITREQIEASGRSSLADLLRDIAANSFGSFRPQSGSSAQSLAALDLRGLGSERTLILIDGRRAPQAPFSPTAQDLSAIPLGAVERIEILRDGASAIYGSGAIAGVVNIIIRKDFQGTELMHGRGYADTGGGDTNQAGFLMGVPTANGNVVMGASYNTRDIVFTRDLIAAGIGNPGSSLFGNNYVTPADSFATLSAVPGGCSASAAFIVAPGAFSTVDLNGDGTNDLCRYDFTRVSADEASTENMALFAKGKFAINTDWNVYSAASIARATSFGRYAPAPAILFVPGANSGIDHDGDGTDDDVYVYHRYDALGNRDNTVEGTVYDILAGFEGNVANVQLDFGARYNEYHAFDIGRNYVVDALASAAATAGTYNFADPLANSPAVLNAMKATVSRDMHWTARQWWVSGAPEPFALPAGEAQLRVGLEGETVDYDDRYDSLSEGGAVGGSAGNSAGTGQTTTAGFAEFGMPLLPGLEANAALRYDDVSRVGANRSSRLAVSWQAASWLAVRAGWGEGFRAPQLDVLSMLPSTSSGGTPADPIEILTINNPLLESEQSEQYSLGLDLAPWSWLALDLGYYDVTMDGVISFFSTEDLISLQSQGLPLPPGLSLTFGPGGILESVVAGYGNYGQTRTLGLDAGATATAPFAGGRLSSRLQYASVLEYQFDEVDIVGERGAPEWRATWDTSWRAGPLSMAWNQVAVAGQQGSGTWWTHDVQMSHDLPFNAGTLTVGALNVTNELPESIPYDGRPFNFYLYNAYGRTPYVRYTLTFR
jgi:iron complex outermembrane receptor protein